MEDSLILDLSPRQTQIKLFEINEIELEERVIKYLENGIKPDVFEGEILRKYDEMRGINYEDFKDVKIELNDLDKRYVEALKKNPHLNLQEFLKNG